VVTYTFSVQNTGNVTLTNLTLSDSLLSGLNCTAIASLAPNATQSFTCTGDTYTVTQADVDTNGGGDSDIDNTATVTGTTPGGGTVTDTDSVAVTLPVQTPALTLTKTAAPTTVTAVGDVVTYTFSVQNTGNVTLTNLTLSDSLLSGLNCTTIASLAPNASQSFTCTGNTYTVTQADIDTSGGGDGDIDNTATVTGTAPGGGTVTDTDCRSDPACPEPCSHTHQDCCPDDGHGCGQCGHLHLLGAEHGQRHSDEPHPK
jgi:large repetitive protein